MTLEELKTFTEYLRSVGVASFEIGETVKVSFDPRAFVAHNVPATKEEVKRHIKDLIVDGEKEAQKEEEMLFWST